MSDLARTKSPHLPDAMSAAFTSGLTADITMIVYNHPPNTPLANVACLAHRASNAPTHRNAPNPTQLNDPVTTPPTTTTSNHPPQKNGSSQKSTSHFSRGPIPAATAGALRISAATAPATSTATSHNRGNGTNCTNRNTANRCRDQTTPCGEGRYHRGPRQAAGGGRGKLFSGSGRVMRSGCSRGPTFARSPDRRAERAQNSTNKAPAGLHHGNALRKRPRSGPAGLTTATATRWRRTRPGATSGARADGERYLPLYKWDAHFTNGMVGRSAAAGPVARAVAVAEAAAGAGARAVAVIGGCDWWWR